MSTQKLTGKFHLGFIESSKGWYSNNLYVDASRIEILESEINLILDLFGNARTLNSSATEDYPSLVEDLSRITLLDIDDANFQKRLLGKLRQHPDLQRFVTLIVSGGVYEKYFVRYEARGSGTRLHFSKG